MQTVPAVGQHFRRGNAFAGAKFTLLVDVLVSHVQAAVGVHVRHQRAEANAAAGIRRPDDVVLLMVMKDGVGTDFAGFGIADSRKPAIVVIEIGHGMNSGDSRFSVFAFKNQLQMEQSVLRFSDLPLHLRDQVGE